MNKIDNKRIIDYTFNNKKNKFQIFCNLPLTNTKCDTLIFYIPGLNGNGSLVHYFDDQVFNKYLVCSFDPRAQGDNQLKASRNYKKYIDDIFFVINNICNKFNNIKNIFLIGESWGANLAFLFNKYYPNVTRAIIGWNMPYHVIDTSDLKGWKKIKNSLKVLLTYTTNINTFDDTPFNEQLTNNKVLIRIVKTIKNNRISNRVILAAWKSFKQSWRYLLKNATKNNLFYIQSSKDALISKDIVNKFVRLHPINFREIDGGYHILTFDESANKLLFNDIDCIIKSILIKN